MQAIRRIQPGPIVAVAALGAYVAITQLLTPSPARTGMAILLPLIGIAVAMTVVMGRLQRRGADREATRRMFEIAGALAMSAPVLGLAVHLQG